MSRAVDVWSVQEGGCDVRGAQCHASSRSSFRQTTTQYADEQHVIWGLTTGRLLLETPRLTQTTQKVCHGKQEVLFIF